MTDTLSFTVGLAANMAIMPAFKALFLPGAYQSMGTYQSDRQCIRIAARNWYIDCAGFSPDDAAETVCNAERAACILATGA